MQWLISQIWIALAAAGFLGILFGMAVRGLFVGGKIRRAQVDRDVAKTELEQSRTEVDALYAAQRRRQEETAQTVSGDDRLQNELDERETKLSGLSDELSAARQELDTLKAQANGGAEVSDVATSDSELQERNTWLEQRVAELEADLSSDTPSEQIAGEAGAGNEELAQLRWRNRYLEGRLAYHEDDAAAQDDAAQEAELDAAPVEDISADDVETETQVEAVADPVAEDDEHPSEAVLKALDDVNIVGVQPTSADAPPGEGDDLTEINGVGPRIAEVLNDLGIWSYAQIAEWSPENIAWIEQHLSFDGRVEREDWIAQASLLAETVVNEDA